MNHDYPAAILANFDFDYRAAYAHLAKAYLALERQHVAESSSRFFEISRFERDSEILSSASDRGTDWYRGRRR